MRGLRYPESEKFENYFALVQGTMHKSNCVFFLDTGDGNEFETEFMEGEELVGWVIPFQMADEFEAKFLAEECLDEYRCHYYHIDWGANPRHLKIRCHRCEQY